MLMRCRSRLTATRRSAAIDAGTQIWVASMPGGQTDIRLCVRAGLEESMRGGTACCCKPGMGSCERRNRHSARRSASRARRGR